MLHMFRGPLEEITSRNRPNTSGGREEALKRPEAAGRMRENEGPGRRSGNNRMRRP